MHLKLLVWCVVLAVHGASGLEVVIDYSFSIPDQFGVATPESANCCPYGYLPDNNTQFKVPPTVFGIGTQKGGTTTLYMHLWHHPQMHAPDTKELHFLDGVGNQSYAQYLSRWKWNKKGPKSLVLTDGGLHQEVIPPPAGSLFEISPSYMFVPFAACKAKVISPNAKIIVFLRDPVERAYSSFSYATLIVYGLSHKITGWMRRSFWGTINKGIRDIEAEPTCDFQTGRGLYSYNDCVGCMMRWPRNREVQKACGYRPFVTLTDPNGGFECNFIGKEVLLRGMYGPQLAWWFTLMDPSQFKIINSADFFEHPLAVMKSVGNFLDLHPSYTSKMLHSSRPKANTGRYRKENPRLVKRAKRVLREFFRRPNLELYRLLHETGHTDFKPFETDLQSQSILNCSDVAVARTGVCGDVRFLKLDSENPVIEDRLPQKVMEAVHTKNLKKEASNLTVESASLVKMIKQPNTMLTSKVHKQDASTVHRQQPVNQSPSPEEVNLSPREVNKSPSPEEPGTIVQDTADMEQLSTIKVVLEPNAVVYSKSTQFSLTSFDRYLHAAFGSVLVGFLVYAAFLRRSRSPMS